MTVGGHRAKIQIEHPGTCARMGGVESVAVIIERPSVPDNWWGIDACIGGPDVATAEHQLQAMLATVTLPKD